MADFGSNGVGFPNRQIGIHGDVHFDVQTMAQPTCSNFSDRLYLRHLFSHVLNFVDDLRFCTIKYARKYRLSTLNDDSKNCGGDEQPDDRIGQRITKPYAERAE